MFKKLLLLLVLIAAYQGWKQLSQEPEAGKAAAHNEIIMYSLTTCGYCKAKARELRSERIAFKEYYIDKDRRRRDELNRKLQKAGYPPRSYGTPIMDVHGWMLPNNPSMDMIKEYMNKAR